MAAELYYNAFVPAFSNIGVPLSRSKLYFYLTETTTLANVYTDDTLATALPNPVVADLAGKYPDIYLDDSIVYSVRQFDEDDTPIGDAVDPYIPGQAIAGPSGPSSSTYTSLVDLKAAPASNLIYSLVLAGSREDYYYETANAPYTADDVDTIKLDDVSLTVGALISTSSAAAATGGSALLRAYQATLPLGPINIPAAFNNQLNVSIYWDGTKVQFDQKPYDLIDFEKFDAVNHYYVNYADGNNGNAGTSTGSGNSWKTLDYAVDNATSPAIVHLEDDWIGYLSSDSSPKIFSGKIKLKGEGPSGRTGIFGMRESYDAASFAFSSSGASGAFVSTTASAKQYRAQFDGKYRDAQGIPRPLTVAADQATCETTPGTFFYDSGSTYLYVHLFDGRSPDPGLDGWIFAESAYDSEFQQSLTTSAGIWLLENIEFCNNVGATASGAGCRYRPQTSGSVNTAILGLKNVLSFGSQDNGFELYDGSITVVENCHAGYNRTDGLNYHSFVTTGTKGEYITVYEYDCSAKYSGFDGMDDQQSLSASANGTTSHDSMHIMRCNTITYSCNGAIIADVNGVLSLNYNVQGSLPTGTAAPQSIFWHEKYFGEGTTKLMYLWGCAAFDHGDTDTNLIDNTAQAGGSANDGEVRVQYWRGQTDGAVVGTLKDWDGADL